MNKLIICLLTAKPLESRSCEREWHGSMNKIQGNLKGEQWAGKTLSTEYESKDIAPKY